MQDKEIAGVRFRFDGIAWAVGTNLDGDWSYEDTHARTSRSAALRRAR